MTALAKFAPEDVLNEVLQAVRLRSALYCRARMTSTWGFRVEKRDHARFHYVTEGQCWVDIDGSRDPIQLEKGDLVILIHGQAHSLRDQLDSPVERLADLLVRLPLDKKKNFVWENGGACTQMLCGGFRLEERAANPLLTSLPPVLVIRASADDGVSSRPLFTLLESELDQSVPGWEAFVSRISDVIFLQAIRASLAAECDRVPGLVRGLSDPAVTNALTAVHSRLHHSWSVEALAREAGLSRSAFSLRFTKLVGEPPMSYVSRWRLNRAAFCMRSSDLSVAEVASRMGYQSEPVFSRAFKRCFGLSPRDYRSYCAASGTDRSETRALTERVPLYPSDFREALQRDHG